MKSLRFLAILPVLLAAPGFAADERSVKHTAKGTASIELDRTEWSAIEPITGKLILQVTEVRDRNGNLLDAVKLNQPKLNIVFPDDMAVVLPQVRWRTVFFPTIKVGHRYELQFSIRIDDAFEKLVKKGDEAIAMFKPGKYRLSATVDSPPRPAWEEVPKSAFIELHQQFNSESKAITIEPATSARVFEGGEVKAALAQAEGELKHRIVTFYAKRKVLSREDVLAAINAAEGKPKAELAALYLSLNYPASDLAFFTAINRAVKLTGHPATPFYFLVRPQQRIRFDCDLGNVHRLRVGELDALLTTKKQVDLDAPQAQGVYEMYDDVHKKAWGWLLVYKDVDAIAAQSLRPDTRELSAKVAEALFKQDEQALADLGAPGLRAADLIKKVRFQLADGDVRYHESTGGTSRVKTRMKINAAPKDKDPVFARELWLEFVLVGEDLKLTNAAVWDVEK